VTRRVWNRHLLTLMALAGLASGLVLAWSGRSTQEPTRPALDLPRAVAGWTGSRGAPEDILPEDPRARHTTRWTYRKGGEVIWVAVGFYDSRNDPQSRPALDKIVPRRGASSLENETFSLRLPGAGAPVAPMNHLEVARGNGRLDVLYWYQLGSRSIASQYRFRLALFLDTVLGRTERLGLVRIARAGGGQTPWGAPDVPGAFLRALVPEVKRVMVN
jgi:EpsI family protein